MVKEYQAATKARRAQKHNELPRLERLRFPEQIGPLHKVMDQLTGAVTEDSDETSASEVKPLFMTGTASGCSSSKLAHRWHRPFRVKEKVQEFAYEFDLPDRSGYRFYAVVHVSRLKAVGAFNDRLNTRLAAEVTDASRQDFDEALLPADSWETDHVAGGYEVEAILDDQIPLSTSTEKFKVKWMGYEEPTWEPTSNLSCGGLLYDYLCEKRRDRRLQMVQVANGN
ncbi:LOW QUALITY PROTEIN: hypothetical protein PHMEG_00010865 [Phytophthora megakarya]|uniref:Chromo domain-containing protein n=1 Tax=Phytophthora megakarya TaxID=4795 RepID=A0A225WCN2_9STRA|nr:LOW QUALITY PROTEIN: hypothetical protein PHMEG_00010865 [Phytophthora megakarya]